LTQLEERSRSLQIEQRSRQIGDAIAQMTGRVETRGGHSPLLVSETHLRSHADAIRAGSVFGAEERFGELETRAAVTVGTHMGSAGDWGANSAPAPITLRAFSGIPNTPLSGASAQMPSVTLPAGAAGVAETANHGEFDAAAVANLSALRYGRWTLLTAAGDEFDSLDVLNRSHAVGIARDLNLLDGGVIQTAAGAAVAFSATLYEQSVREAILKVAAAALVDPSDVVIFGRSASLAPIVGYSPASGEDRGSVSLRSYGARVYVHEAATAKVVTAFAPQAFRVFATNLRSASSIDPKSGGNTFGQWLHSTPPGVGIVGGAAAVTTLV
jgi:hypothetical protein